VSTSYIVNRRIINGHGFIFRALFNAKVAHLVYLYIFISIVDNKFLLVPFRPVRSYNCAASALAKQPLSKEHPNTTKLDCRLFPFMDATLLPAFNLQHHDRVR
jgi:hypothetical protein